MVIKKKKIKIRRNGAGALQPALGLSVWQLPNLLAGISAVCQGFWLAASWLLKLKRLGFEAPGPASEGVKNG